MADAKSFGDQLKEMFAAERAGEPSSEAVGRAFDPRQSGLTTAEAERLLLEKIMRGWNYYDLSDADRSTVQKLVAAGQARDAVRFTPTSPEYAEAAEILNKLRPATAAEIWYRGDTPGRTTQAIPALDVRQYFGDPMPGVPTPQNIRWFGGARVFYGADLAVDFVLLPAAIWTLTKIEDFYEAILADSGDVYELRFTGPDPVVILRQRGARGAGLGDPSFQRAVRDELDALSKDMQAREEAALAEDGSGTWRGIERSTEPFWKSQRITTRGAEYLRGQQWVRADEFDPPKPKKPEPVVAMGPRRYFDE